MVERWSDGRVRGMDAFAYSNSTVDLRRPSSVKDLLKVCSLLSYRLAGFNEEIMRWDTPTVRNLRQQRNNRSEPEKLERLFLINIV